MDAHTQPEALPSGVIVRAYDAAIDEDFVVDSWKKSYRPYAFGVPHKKRDDRGISWSWDGASPLRTSTYKREHRVLIMAILDRAHTLMLADLDDPEHVMGYICSEDVALSLPVGRVTLLHYIYVKKPYRERGLARALLTRAEINPASPAVFTHRTKVSDERLARYCAEFNPYKAWGNL